MRLVRVQRASIARLRRLFGMASSERTRDVVGAQASGLAKTTIPPRHKKKHPRLRAAPRYSSLLASCSSFGPGGGGRGGKTRAE